MRISYVSQTPHSISDTALTTKKILFMTLNQYFRKTDTNESSDRNVNEMYVIDA